MPTPTYSLFVDDSGSRLIDRPSTPRRDGVDHFAMGGLLIKAEDVEAATTRLQLLRNQYDITAPFHSTKMRGRKGEWSWLGAADQEVRASRLMSDLTGFLCGMTGHATACVIHRPGYEARYSGIARSERWRLCKTAYAILVERAAKIALRDGRRLAVYVEQTGKREDSDVRDYHRAMRQNGMMFDPETSGQYGPLPAMELERTLLQNPNFFAKSSLLGQVADLVLYALVKGRYDPGYQPYRALRVAGRVIDDALLPHEHHLGVKYSCFDGA